MTAISVNDLSFAFGTNIILDKISFALDEKDKLGVIGVNGCGKSTLFKLILGELEPADGEIFISKGKTVGFLRQDGAFEISEELGRSALEQMYSAFPELLRDEKRLTELENELASCDPHAEPERHARLTAAYTDLTLRFSENGGLEYKARCRSLLSHMGYTDAAMELDVSLLSGGQRTRLALSRQLVREPDIFLLDEPTNHLDIETLTWFESFLASYKKCVIVISHDRYFLDRVTNKTLALEYGKAKLYTGGYTASMAQRKIDREIAEKHYRDQQKEIARQEAYIAKQRQWNRERNIIAAESRLKLLAKMDKLERPKDTPKGIKIRFSEALSSGNEVLRAKDLAMGFGEKRLFEKVNFLIQKNERVFIVGPNGCGKSTLARLILGEFSPTAGYLEAGYNVEIGYYDQENQNLDFHNTVLEELWSTYPTLPEVEIRRTLASFRFLYEDTEKLVGQLSGGERVRLTLAKLMLSKVNVLLLDEPTNHLDIASREALEEALEGFGGTIITVSHDRYLIDKLATRIIEPIAPALGGGTYDCPILHTGAAYAEFIAFREAHSRNAQVTEVAAPSVSAGKEAYLKNKQAAAEARKQEARRKKLSAEAEALERRIGEIDAELYGSAAADYVRAAELSEEKERVEERLLEIYEEIGV